MTLSPSRNMLADATSPYLLQHKDNPVHWRPWGRPALDEAAARNVPVLLSVGYAACHWCHVMAHESFEDPSTAAVMNALFVNIKVDREERPDIDALYMNALHALGEPGGWPLTMFLAPDGRPFWGGTYFPRHPQYGRPSFTQVLHSVSSIYANERDKVDQNREALTAHLSTPPRRTSTTLTPALLEEAAGVLLTVVDPVNGGTKGAPKFPQGPFLALLWRAYARTGDVRFRDAVLASLTQIARGGIYDHVGGGLARYAVDEEWLVPHFEKMLYDNAQFLDLLTLAWRESGQPLFAARMEETVEWLRREMLTQESAFASSLDADTDGIEGGYYVWLEDEIREVLGEGDAARFAAAYDVTSAGNWEGCNVLNRLRSEPWAGAAEEAGLAAMRAKLLAARDNRVPPARDDKVLADWNGLVIAALARAGEAAGREDWLALGIGAYRFVSEAMNVDGRLHHASRAGRPGAGGLSSDYAQIAAAALALHQATAEPAYLADAEGFIAAADAHHWDETAGAYHLAAHDAGDVVLRRLAGEDEATPNPNAVLVDVLVRLFHLTGDGRYRDRADRILSTFTGEMLANAFAHASLWNGFDTRLNAVQVVLVGPAGARKEALRQAALASPLPARLVLDAGEGVTAAGHPAAGKTAVEGRPSAYVCRGETCAAPTLDPAALAASLRPGISR